MSKQSEFLYANSLSKGVWYNRIGRVIAPSDVEAANFTCSTEQRIAYNKELDETLSNYREQQANLTDEQKAERDFEMRAAFGEGETVVNILTGEKFTT